MNRKLILLFSLVIVTVGVAGILNNNKDDANNLTSFGEQKKERAYRPRTSVQERVFNLKKCQSFLEHSHFNRKVFSFL